MQPTAEMLKDRGYHFVNVVGELQPGTSILQAQRELDAIASHIPTTQGGQKETFHATPYQEALTGPVRPTLLSLFAALMLVLLIACANVSNLLIARCLGRQKEFAVRAALGASRLRLVRQLLAEGMMLSLAGCGVGLILAQLAMLAMSKLPAGTIPRADSIAIHWTVLLTLAAIAMLTTLLSSLLPALLVARANPQAALQAASRGIGSRAVSRRLSGWLVAGEVALSTLLLVGTGLLFHTLWNLQQSRLGFDTAHLTIFQAMPADAAGFSGMAVSQDAGACAAFCRHARLSARSRSHPAASRRAECSADHRCASLRYGHRNKLYCRRSAQMIRRISRRLVFPPSVETTPAPWTPPYSAGRMIDDEDVATTPFVVVINESLAKKYFAGQDPLQKQIDLGGKDTGMIKPYTIVGVLADQVDSNVGGTVRPFILVPHQQVPTTSLFYQALLETVVSFVVKTRGDFPVAAEMRSVFHQTAPGFALDGFQTMQQAVEKNTFNQRLGLNLVGSFAALAVAMVIAGLYGVLSQLVSYRRREIGVRMALGATRKSVAQLVLRQGSILIGAGLGIGLLLSFGAARLIKSFLYQVQPLDILTYVAVAVTLSSHRTDRRSYSRTQSRAHRAHGSATHGIETLMSASFPIT